MHHIEFPAIEGRLAEKHEDLARLEFRPQESKTLEEYHLHHPCLVCDHHRHAVRRLEPYLAVCRFENIPRLVNQSDAYHLSPDLDHGRSRSHRSNGNH